MPANLSVLVAAQNATYQQVLRELAAGRKESHWIWFIFPQVAGLGSSLMSQKFGIISKADARRYLDHSVLGPRLRECTRLMLAVPDGNIRSIMGYPDDLQFHSSMTLFAVAAPDESIFEEALQKFFNGEHDPLTLKLLAQTDEDSKE